MRSGSTLLQHILGGHSQIRSYSDLSSTLVLPRLFMGWRPRQPLVVKPMDLLFLQQRYNFYRHFDRFLWLARDPRDSYLSSVESGYAYLFWPRGAKRGEMVEGIDTGLLKRWQRIYRHYFEHQSQWQLVRYEDLVEQPEKTVGDILQYLELPYEKLFPFDNFSLLQGGDYKLARSNTVNKQSARRFIKKLSAAQLQVFDDFLGEEMEWLGYADHRRVEQASKVA